MTAADAATPAHESRPKRDRLSWQLASPLRSFLATESGSAGLLLAATAIALLWANSPWSSAYEELWATKAAISVGGADLTMDLGHWVNDGLMALFFLVVGLEVRREISVGELTDRRHAYVPALAAAGGILIPTLLFLAINPSGEEARGWGVVIGTDTAFVLGALALVGPSFPTQLRVFILTLTVFDDIAAVAIIGLVYSESLDTTALVIAGLALVALFALDRVSQWRAWVYVAVGTILWVATYESGLHPSIAGMLGGLAIGAAAPRRSDVEEAATLARAFRQSPMAEVGRDAKRGLQRAVSVNEQMQSLLHPWSSYVIVPVFALANAGVDLRDGVLREALSSPLTWGIVLGLVAGKAIGVSLGAFGAIKLGLGKLPRGVGEGQVVGGAALSGIGFTVSLLVAHLAWPENERLEEQAVVGVLIAAALAFIVGWIAFKLAAVLRGETTASLPLVLDTPVDPERDRILGPLDAPLTLVEYGDFECPFCANSTGMLDDLRERFGDELRYVFRHLPLPDVHEHAELAAAAAEAAAEQGEFWPMHDILFEHQGALDHDDLFSYAEQLGLDLDRFGADLDDDKLGRRIREDVATAEASGARGTPTFFVGDRRHVGPYDAATLGDMLEQSRNVRREDLSDLPR